MSDSSPNHGFAIYVDGQRANLHLIDVQAIDQEHTIARLGGAGFEVERHGLMYTPRRNLVEQWLVVRVTGEQPITITRLDVSDVEYESDDYELLYFTSDWGQEFEPVRVPLKSEIVLETRAGRSSKGMHPCFVLRAPLYIQLISIAWSGNWIARFEPLANGGFRFSCGLHDWEFSKTLQPGESMESPHISYSNAEDLNWTSQEYATIGRDHWYPHNELSDSLPVEWNHWWSYEDADIDEQVFLANVAQAAALGFELVTLDAGWFGTGEHWYQQRGDWQVVNQARFPRGLRVLADALHQHGLKFGLWCEIEGLGAQAALNSEQPDFAARRDDQSLGYVCFGNPAAQEWAFDTLSRLIRDYACDWLKLDFNLDPGAGCNRVDHGHGAGDGLYEHVTGYYRLLDRVRAAFPDVVLENCSSGGLRIDLGMAQHTHVSFLSDPDWPEHSLQVFWGATTILAPNACLHWSFSQWRPGNGPPQQNFDPHDPKLTPRQFDYYTRIGMLGAFGVSQKLVDLPDWVAHRLAYHVQIYKEHVRRFVRAGDLYRLTDQPRRDGSGDRWCAFQYSLLDEHLLFVFRLPGSEAKRAIKLQNLAADQVYQIETLDGAARESMTGRDLMEQGITFAWMQVETSALLRIY